MDKFVAISDPTRRKIIEMLCREELSSGDIARQFDSSPPAISQHLKILRNTEIVDVRIDAQKRIYTLSKNGLKDVDLWVQKVNDFWIERLNRLEQELRGINKQEKVK